VDVEVVARARRETRGVSVYRIMSSLGVVRRAGCTRTAALRLAARTLPPHLHPRLTTSTRCGQSTSGCERTGGTQLMNRPVRRTNFDRPVVLHASLMALRHPRFQQPRPLVRCDVVPRLPT